MFGTDYRPNLAIIFLQPKDWTLKLKQPITMANELISHLTDRGEVRTYSKGQLIVCEGDAANVMYVIVSGQCKAITQDDRGRELIYSVLGVGEIFGELFLDGGARSASVRATLQTECILRVLPRFHGRLG